MKNPRPILLMFLLLSTYLLEAANFQNGYVVNIQGDTLKGFIDYQDWSYNPFEIAFKPGKNRSVVKYYANDLKGFGVMERQYVATPVQKEVSPFRDSELEKDPNLHLAADTVFLQRLIGGDKPLLYLKEWNDKENFYIYEDSAYVLLLHKTYVEYTENNYRKEYHNMRFIGQLTRYFWNDPSMMEKVSETYYSRTDLEQLFVEYLKLTNQKKTFVNSDYKVSTTFGLVAGASVSMVELETDYFKAGLGPSTDFTGGVSLNLAMSGKLRFLSLYNELLYSSYAVQNYVGPYMQDSWAEFNFSYLRMNNLVRFSRSWFFLNAGMSNGYCIKHYSSEFDDIRKYEIGLVFGAGIHFKHLSLEFREDIGDGMSPYVNIYAQTKRYQVLLGYTF
jgi:hypothetical protein